MYENNYFSYDSPVFNNLRLFYNAQEKHVGMAGKGWITSFERRLVIEDEHAWVLGEDGARTEFYIFGVYGDDGNTYKNVRFYFDKNEYKTREELIENARIDGIRVCDLEDTVTVTECDGCYPDSTEAFRALMREQQ